MLSIRWRGVPLGGRYFGESKKAALTLIWNSALRAGIGMPIHSSFKTLYVRRNGDTDQTPSTYPSFGWVGMQVRDS